MNTIEGERIRGWFWIEPKPDDRWAIMFQDEDGEKPPQEIANYETRQIAQRALNE